ncbi:MAG TPA: hypothetical protein VIK89_15810 [Cytophagaceae bacterium]
MTKRWLIIFFVLVFSGCKKDTSVDPQLIGTWDDFNSIYTFRTDFTYSLEFYHNGYGPDSVKIDSVYGIYELDRKKNNLRFFQKGYREKLSGLIVPYEKNDNWNYSIENDSVLTYTSNTRAGKLVKR